MHSYLITSPEFYSQEPVVFASRVQTQLQKHQPDFALLRDKETQCYEALAKSFLGVCVKFEGLRAYLHREIELAQKLGAHGVHLSSDMFGKIADAKARGLEVVVSAHTLEDVLFAQNAGADYVTYSPIFASPNKGEPKGVDELKRVVEKADIKIFALGGILTQEHINAVEQSGAFGFASIRYFY